MANQTGKSPRAPEGLSLATVLHPCLPTGIIVVSHTREILTVTREAELILEWSDSRATRMWQDLPKPLAAIVDEVLETGQPTARRVIELPVKDERRKGAADHARVFVTAVPVRRGAKVSEIVLAISDSAIASQGELQLERLDRLAKLGTLAAGMVHEIKNALVASRTFMDLLLEKNQDSELADVVRRELVRIDFIVNRMLKFTASTQEPFKPVHLHEVLEHAIRLIQPQLKEKAFELIKSFQAKADLVEGNEYELQQAAVNLLLNGVEAMTADGRLTISTESVERHWEDAEGRAQNKPSVRVSVQDTGIGITPEHRQHLFEPFFTTKSNGTGLGLAVTRRIVQEHHGAIDIESKPGQGTTFTITLPLHKSGG